MAGYSDPLAEGNSAKYHTGQLCIEGCGRPAGTAWSPFWCFECNVERIDRISQRFEETERQLARARALLGEVE